MAYKGAPRGFDPVRLGLELERRVEKGRARRYYRFRCTRFYGGSATGDVVGCNLRCIFCWSGRPRWDTRLGWLVEPEEAYSRLRSCLDRRGYRYMRLSGGEPTIGWRHLTELLGLVDSGGRGVFILETNGILIGALRERARDLSRFNRLHVRLSIKACSEELFAKLTLASPDALRLQIEAARNLADYGVSFHVAVFASYGDEECWRRLLRRLAEAAGEEVLDNIEVEYLTLYPSVERRLRFYERLLGVRPRVVFKP